MVEETFWHSARKSNIGKMNVYSEIPEAWIPTIRKHNSRSTTKRTCEGTTSNSRNNNEDRNAPIAANQRHINNRPHRLMKTSSVAVEMSRLTTQSHSIVRQTNKRSSCLSYTTMNNKHIFNDKSNIINFFTIFHFRLTLHSMTDLRILPHCVILTSPAAFTPYGSGLAVTLFTHMLDPT